ncbi:MAG TPA: PhoD-like phosphatase N-terminal domain-containing protein [Kofleriaceae bacterium]
MLTRRRFVIGALSTGAWACSRSAVVRSRPPRITHGVQSGDVQTGRALIWARCDEPARMQVEWDTTMVDVTADALTVALRGIDGRERDRVELPHA